MSLEKVPDSKLNVSEIVSDFIRLGKHEDESYNDPITIYAPSECTRDISRFFDREANKIWEKWEKKTGMSRHEIYEEICSRVDGKFAYSFLPHLMIPVNGE